MKMLAHDPGTTSYGYSVVEGVMAGSRLKFRVLENGLVPCTIKNLKDHDERRKQMRRYRNWVREKIEHYEVTHMIGERYMTRGINGSTIESVNMMLGVLQCFNLSDKFIPAATWKNALTRAEIVLKEEYRYARTTPHQLDASLIGIYGLFREHGFKDFGSQMDQSMFDRIVSMVENTSTVELKNRKHVKGQ